MMEASRDVEELAYRVSGAAIEVHDHLGRGLLESMYEQAMAVELDLRAIRFRRQYQVAVEYKGAALGSARIDLLIEDKLVLELKAIDANAMIHVVQTNAYLAMTGLELGLILNFNVPALKERGIRRVIRSVDS